MACPYRLADSPDLGRDAPFTWRRDDVQQISACSRQQGRGAGVHCRGGVHGRRFGQAVCDAHVQTGNPWTKGLH